jgi:hypothetical protein
LERPAAAPVQASDVRLAYVDQHVLLQSPPASRRSATGNRL